MDYSSISERQLEIIGAAGKILTESGVGGLTTKNLAKAMHFSEGAIYRHFTGKEELIECMLTYLAQNMSERFEKVTALDCDADQKLATLFREQFAFFKHHPHFVVAVFSEGLLEESAKINAKIMQLMEIKMKSLHGIIYEGQKNALFTIALAPEDIVQIVMGTFRLQMFKWRLANFQFNIEEKGEVMILSLLTLLKPQ